MRTLQARRRVPRPAAELYEQLSDLRGHWSLAGRWVQTVELRDDGGTVRVRGPLGLRRTIATSLTETVPDECVVGEARAGRTHAAISWLLEPDPEGPQAPATVVTLRAEILEAGPLDRALLALGGARWMQGRFRTTLDRLA